MIFVWNGGPVYELFLLGKLFARPWYGYEFHQVLNAFVGPSRLVSWGTIYPLFRRLQTQGLIRPISNQTSKGGPDRHAYTITAAGKQRFHELMIEERKTSSDYREAFRAKVGNFSRVDKSTQKSVTRNYLQRILAIQAHTTQQYDLVQHVASLNEGERIMILRAIRHERALVEYEINWLQKEMAEFL
jgi:DNA-binding PadR family transcriptional regulator